MESARGSISDNGERLLDVFRREPDRTRVLVRFGLAVPVVIALWAWWGHLAVLQPLVMLVAYVMIAAYGAGLVVWAGLTVRDASRWEVEGAQEARRLIALDRRAAHKRSDHPASDEAADQPQFHHLYFLFRLRDEIKAARRHGSAMSVVVIRLPTSSAPSPELLEQVDFEMARLAADHVQTFRAPTCLGALEYGFCLPEKDHKATRDLVHQLVGALGRYRSTFGIASYPEDATEAEALLDMASAEASGEDSVAV